MAEASRQGSARADSHGRSRVVIERVSPEIDAGRFPIKRVPGERVIVEADVFADGHDQLAAVLRYRPEAEAAWTEGAMEPVGNDRWRGEFRVTRVGRYRYTLQAWIDRFGTWRRDLARKAGAGQDVTLELLTGAELVEEAERRARGADVQRLHRWVVTLRSTDDPMPARLAAAQDDELAGLVARHAERRFATSHARELVVVVERERARCGAWYELFPRSSSPEPGRHGTFRDCEARLDDLARLGIDVLYFPPVHPIGRTNRKGKNNRPTPGPGDPGSPWAIGSSEGGHKAVHPELGTLEDFRRLVQAAGDRGIEIALDLAFQCSPDHPYVKEHPEWFRWRPDGTVQYAENPPKRYEDIYPFEFESDAWRELWEELKSVVVFWIEQGVRIFRVDNPHTKPFAFWEWLIAGITSEHPDVLFLSEAFTRPKVMHELAKLGFSQSYTYFAWRNTRRELVEYLTELTQTELREYYRPSLWPNTPDILTEYLQTGGRPAFAIRLVLAATLGANYGIYGPAFELCEHEPRHPGSEEYLDSEKYEIRRWDGARADSLAPLVARVNRIRRDNPALQSDWSLRFHPVDNEELLCYSKRTEDGANTVLVVVNLNPHHVHAGWVDLDLDALGLAAGRPFQVHDLLDDARYLWSGRRNYVELRPEAMPAHIFRVRHLVRREQDFEYYL
jgi:starch synthase (maltosyl-transferring)